MRSETKLPLRVQFRVAACEFRADILNKHQEDRNRVAIGENHKAWRWFFMKLKNSESLPEHLQDPQGLPRNRAERLLWIKRKVDEGYYENNNILEAVAEAFLDPPTNRRAGEQALPSGKD